MEIWADLPPLLLLAGFKDLLEIENVGHSVYVLFLYMLFGK